MAGVRVLKSSTLWLPPSMLSGERLLTIDLGSSQAKAVFTPIKSSQTEERQKSFGEPDDKKLVELRCVSCSIDNVEAFVEHLALEAKFDRSSPVSCIGAKVQPHKTLIESALGAKIEVQFELGPFARGVWMCLTNLSSDELMYPVEDYQYINQMISATWKVNTLHAELARTGVLSYNCHALESTYCETQRAKFASDDVVVSPPGEERFPCLVAMLGSVFGFQILKADGTYDPYDVTYLGGRTFLGLCSVILDTENFDEIIALAKAGNRSNTDEADNEKKETDGEPGKDESEMSAYDMMWKSDLASYFIPFGKYRQFRKGGKSRADMANSLLNLFIAQLVDSLRSAVLGSGIKNVYLVGGFVSHPHVRTLIRGEILRRDALCYTLRAEHRDFNFYFLKHSAFFGALGCTFGGSD